MEQLSPNDSEDPHAARHLSKKSLRPKFSDTYFDQLAELWRMVVKPVIQALGLTVR